MCTLMTCWSKFCNHKTTHLTCMRRSRLWKKYGMELNPLKCAFRVVSGKFIGYIVSNRGIEVNSEKIKVDIDMQSPKNLKQLQQLTNRNAALNWFISWSIDKYLPLFKILRRAFEWTGECEEAFEQLKKYLVSLPLLCRTIFWRSFVSILGYFSNSY